MAKHIETIKAHHAMCGRAIRCSFADYCKAMADLYGVPAKLINALARMGYYTNVDGGFRFNASQP